MRPSYWATCAAQALKLLLHGGIAGPRHCAAHKRDAAVLPTFFKYIITLALAANCHVSLSDVRVCPTVCQFYSPCLRTSCHKRIAAGKPVHSAASELMCRLMPLDVPQYWLLLCAQPVVPGDAVSTLGSHLALPPLLTLVVAVLSTQSVQYWNLLLSTTRSSSSSMRCAGVTVMFVLVLAGTFSAAAAADSLQPSETRSRCVFILGTGRSGSTSLQDAVNQV